MINDEIREYCERNIYAKDWYERKHKLDLLIELSVNKNNMTEKEYNEFVFELGTFSNSTDIILDNDGLLDWFKYYAEYQLSIYYFALKDYEKDKNIARFLQCLEETKLNQEYALNKKEPLRLIKYRHKSHMWLLIHI